MQLGRILRYPNLNSLSLVRFLLLSKMGCRYILVFLMAVFYDKI